MRQIGVSRPALPEEDLPTPEQVFKVRRLGLEEMILFVLGPGVIALGISIGSGEWLLGPLNASQVGLKGLGWIILLSAILQVFYNVELGRYTLATGEAPVLGFGRVWPGYLLWTPLALLSFGLAFIAGGWAVTSGASLFALLNGRVYQPDELRLVQTLGVILLVVAFVLLTIGRKIERSMEAIQAILMTYILVGLLFVAIAVVPAVFWGQTLRDIVIPALPPSGSDPALLGGLAGFTALASGLNFMFIVYYRDKGFGMGSRVGFVPGLFSNRLGVAKETLKPEGVTFAENDDNSRVWKRWFRLLITDQWLVYFPGVLLGMILPIVLVTYLASVDLGGGPTQSNIITYAAEQLGGRYGALLSGWTLLIGFGILFSTQIVIVDLLARNLSDALFGLSSRLRQAARQDVRRIYYPSAIAVILAISFFIFNGSPEQLTIISANLSNLAALIFPLLMIYLNRQLPRPARLANWSIVVLVANTLFFGFFFVNFIWVTIYGTALIRF